MFLKIIFVLLPFLFPTLVSAHAFGALYNLPVPFWLYLYGAATTILVSFLLIEFLKTKQQLGFKRLHFKVPAGVTSVGKIISVILFLLTILSGLIGVNNSVDNFNMTFFWIIFLLGLTYLTPILGNFYSSINPWKTLFFINNKGFLKYPESFGVWPALIFYVILIWVELFFQVNPFKLSILLLQYTVINFIGSFLFGKETWFEKAEVFEVFFGFLGKTGSIKPARHISELIFILFMLSSTAFDGFHSTIPWIKFSLFFGDEYYKIIQRLGLVISPFVYLFVYLIFIYVLKLLVKTNFSLKELALKFALPLIPIALVYNIAHYYTLLFTQGAQIIRLISNPFGNGLNLFGTANINPNIILNAGFVWHSQVAIILIGHIFAIFLSHIIALEIFKDSKKAMISQIPMLVLMVLYTVSGLWILSQPLGGGI